MPNDWAQMARAFLLYLLGAYSVFKVACSLLQLRACVGGELGLGLSCLPLFGHGHTQLGDSALASGALEAPWG